MRILIAILLLGVSSASSAKDATLFPSPCSCHIWVDSDHSYFGDGDGCQLAAQNAITKCSQDFTTQLCEQNISSCELDDGEYPLIELIPALN